MNHLLGIEEKFYPILLKMKLKIDYQEVIKLVLKWEGYTLEQARLKNRNRNRVVARQRAFYFARSMTDTPLAVIGAYLGKHHATVIHACNTVTNLIDTDKAFKSKMLQYDIKLRAYMAKPFSLRFRTPVRRLNRYAYRNTLSSLEIAEKAHELTQEEIKKQIDRLVIYNKYYNSDGKGKNRNC